MQTILITGASSGIGYTTAQLLRSRGYEVFGTSRNPEKFPNQELVPLDVTSSKSITACVEAVLKKSGKIDVLINNIGGGLAGAIEETSLEEAKGIFEASFWSAVRVTKAVLPSMRKRRSGKIIIMSSAGGFNAFPYRTFYSASKFALEGYGESLRHEVRPFGVSVSLVEPAGVNVPDKKIMQAKERIDDYGKAREQFTRFFYESMQKGLPPENVAKTIVRIIETEHPQLRYLVGMQAKSLRLLQRVLPQTTFESFMRRILKLQ